MSATTVVRPGPEPGPGTPPPPPPRPKRRLADEDSIPIEYYGLRRGTVTTVTVLCVLFAVFTLIPIAWLLINSTKTQANIFESFGFWFASPFVFGRNFALLFQNVDGYGIYFQWFGNTVLYAVVGGGGATALAALAGYGFARYRFRGHRALFYLVIGALLVPITAITLPLYLSYAKVHLINSVWGMILPSMVSPVGVYLMKVFVEVSVPPRAHRRGPHRRGRRAADLPPAGAAADGAGADDRAAAERGHGVEQLLPAADHLQPEPAVPAHCRPGPVVRARPEQRQR